MNDAARQPAFPPSPVSDPHLRTFLETIPQIVWTANAAGWIEWYNSRWHEYTGQTPAEAAGWGWQAAHHPADFPKVMERWPHSVATGEAFEMEFRLRRRDGAFRWMLTRVVPLRDEAGNVVRWYGSNTDIDDQKRQIDRAAHIARTMRQAFVPERLPERGDLYFDAVYLPADRDALVGGDWYDAVTLPDGCILISCGEVAGDGLEAAILAGSFRRRITATGLEDPEPARLLTRVNRIAMLQDRSTATAVVGLFDPRERTLRYALAGHPPPVFAAADGSARIAEHGGPPIGASHEAAWRTTSVDLEPGTVVVFYTDGLVACARDGAAAERALSDVAGELATGKHDGGPAQQVLRAMTGDREPANDVVVLVLACGPDLRPAVARVPVTRSRTWRFHSSDARTAHDSRRAVYAHLRAHAADGAELYAAELIVGEALANTVEHAPGLVEVILEWTEEAPVLVVRDGGPGFDAAPASLPTDPFSEDGRGMFLIAALATEVELRRSPGYGMELRCRLPIGTAAPT